MIEIGNVHGPDCWLERQLLVGAKSYGFKFAVLWGFGRLRDAEIAMHILQTKTEIDWDADELTIREQFDAFGGREAARKLIAEHLQW